MRSGSAENGRRFRPVAWRTAALLMTASVVLAGCRGDRRRAPAVVGEPEAGGTLVVGIRRDFGGFNPLISTGQYDIEVMKYALFTPLIQYNEQLEVVPYLAESWELLGDTAVVFQLREDVTWHDGRPVTAEDVSFTFRLAKEPTTASLLGSAFLADVASAEVLDPYTIRFDFARPHAQALEGFWWSPVPKHLLEGIPPEELRRAEFNRNPVGSGPYRFAEWEANRQLVLEPYARFPEALGGPPLPERIVFRIIPEPATLLTELITGGIGVDIDVAANQADQVEQGRALRLFSYASRTFYYIGWNNRRPPFTSAAVRRAMTFAINRQEIIDALLFGFAEVADGPIPPWSPLYPTQVQPLPYDPARARALLESERWLDRDGNGVRESAEGEPLRFTLLTSDAPGNRSMVEIVQAQLREVGAAAEVRVLEFQTMLAQHKARDFDAVFSNWIMDNFRIASAPMALFHSRFADVPLSANRSAVADAELDRWIEAGAGETDPAEARRIWAAFLERLQEIQPFTFMFWADELAGVRRRVQGVVMDPRGELVSIADWWLVGGSDRE